MRQTITLRIARYITWVSGLVVFLAFGVIYFFIYFSVNQRVNQNLLSETQQHYAELVISNKQISFIDLNEWIEREHNSVDVDPVFIQIIDSSGKILEKSSNLRQEKLRFNPQETQLYFTDKKFNNKLVRQVQYPVIDNGRNVGYILVAVSLEDEQLILKNLLYILLISYPLILLLLHFLSKRIATESIQPVQDIINTAQNINNTSLSTRVPLPEKKDELYHLSKTLNSLLDRIETGLIREKQFTADVSHELRTPLTAVKGTLEVLVRKPRASEEYNAKISYCLTELNRAQLILDNLLLIARFENEKVQAHYQKVDLTELIMQNIERYSSQLEEKNLSIQLDVKQEIYIFTDADLLSIVVSNLFSNAVKYSPRGEKIILAVEPAGNKVTFKIANKGKNLPEEVLPHIFDRFFRPPGTDRQVVEGEGLGLAIVKKLCDILQIKVQLQNRPEGGIVVELGFIK